MWCGENLLITNCYQVIISSLYKFHNQLTMIIFKRDATNEDMKKYTKHYYQLFYHLAQSTKHLNSGTAKVFFIIYIFILILGGGVVFDLLSKLRT